ncbi:MAG: relaxase/mobilization nuclease domain-containing protein [Lachnospiraceae bacterium]|nr:relaxase/mobilization nuclease domain-containing protein [Lachnospiraceae bacterium]
MNFECNGKFKNFKNSSFALRRLNDQICREHGYSIIGEEEEKGAKQNSTIRYPEKAAAKRGRSYKERLRQDIDRLLPGCGDYEEFLSRMRAEGYEVKWRGNRWNSVPRGRKDSHVPSAWGRGTQKKSYMRG